jgi:glutaminyl-peptide cyclotransferase
MKNNKKLKAKGVKLKAILLLTFCFLLYACEDKPKKEKSVAVEQKSVVPPAFNEDSAYQYIQSQVDFGPRVPNSKAHQKCGDYLISTLEKAKISVRVQSFEAKAFDGKILKLRNIIGSINPMATKRIILAAHWDTRPFADQDDVNKSTPIDGANDGGSGVGILLEIARTINSYNIKPEIGIDIILFDGEDYGAPESFTGNHTDTYCLGSQYWAKNKGDYSAYFGILLDMVGAKNATFAREGISMQYAPAVVDVVWNTGHKLGYSSYFIYKITTSITDDHYYMNTLSRIPTIDIIEYNESGNNYFGDYWHTHNDNMDVIEKKTLKAVGQTLLEVIYNESKRLI